MKLQDAYHPCQSSLFAQQLPTCPSWDAKLAPILVRHFGNVSGLPQTAKRPALVYHTATHLKNQEYFSAFGQPTTYITLVNHGIYAIHNNVS